jgi:hypothetical protein
VLWSVVDAATSIVGQAHPIVVMHDAKASWNTLTLIDGSAS